VRYGRWTAAEAGDELRAHIGLLGHDLFLYGELSAEENLIFFAKLYGVESPARRVDAALERSRLADRRADRVSGFSRGQRQRIAVERALIHEPRLVLLDEPFTGLDDESAGLLIERLRGLRSQGKIVVMATHDFETADGLLDRAVCLVNGRAQEIDLCASGAVPLRDRYRLATQGVGR
jgi:heme exporter protein A